MQQFLSEAGGRQQMRLVLNHLEDSRIHGDDAKTRPV